MGGNPFADSENRYSLRSPDPCAACDCRTCRERRRFRPRNRATSEVAVEELQAGQIGITDRGPQYVRPGSRQLRFGRSRFMSARPGDLTIGYSSRRSVAGIEGLAVAMIASQNECFAGRSLGSRR